MRPLKQAMASTVAKYKKGGYRHALSIVVPMVVGNAAFTVMQFTDRLLLSRFSSEAIQAALPAGVLSFTLTSFFAAIAGYSSTFVSQYHGAGDKVNCARSCLTGLLISLMFAPFLTAMVPLCNWLLSISGNSASLVAAEKTYAFWMVVAGVPMAFQWVLCGYLTGRSKAMLNTAVSIVVCALNIFLDVVMIFGHFGFPAMGIEGAAIATLVSQVVGVAILVGVILAEREVRRLPWRELSRPDWGLVWRVLHFGLPAGIQIFCDCGSFALFSLLVARYDDLSLATNNIAFSVNNLAMSPIMGFGGAAAILAGQAQGARDSRLARASVWRCQHLAWAYMLLMAAVFVFLPKTLLGAFRSPDSTYTVEQMVGLGSRMLVVLALWGMFDTMSAVLGGGLRGAGDTHFIMKTILFCNWVVWIPAEVLAIVYFKCDIMVTWWIMLGFIVLLSLVFFGRWHLGKWESINIVHQ